MREVNSEQFDSKQKHQDKLRRIYALQHPSKSLGIFCIYMRKAFEASVDVLRLY